MTLFISACWLWKEKKYPWIRIKPPRVCHYKSFMCQTVLGWSTQWRSQKVLMSSTKQYKSPHTVFILNIFTDKQTRYKTLINFRGASGQIVLSSVSTRLAVFPCFLSLCCERHHSSHLTLGKTADKHHSQNSFKLNH